MPPITPPTIASTRCLGLEEDGEGEERMGVIVGVDAANPGNDLLVSVASFVLQEIRNYQIRGPECAVSKIF